MLSKEFSRNTSSLQTTIISVFIIEKILEQNIVPMA